MDSNKDIFLISAEAEMRRFSKLMNKASKEYFSLKDPTTKYARAVGECYRMNKMNFDNTLNLLRQYKSLKEIKIRIGILEKSMKKYLKQMDKKQKINENSIDKQEELEELYYECLIETIALKWVLGVQ